MEDSDSDQEDETKEMEQTQLSNSHWEISEAEHIHIEEQQMQIDPEDSELSSEDEAYRLPKYPAAPQDIQTNWKDLWIKIKDYLDANKTNPNAIWQAYNNLIAFPRKSPKIDRNKTAYYPWKGGVHFLLYVFMRSEEFQRNGSRKIMSALIDIIAAMRYMKWKNVDGCEETGYFRGDLDFDQLLPSSVGELEYMDEFMPQFKNTTRVASVDIGTQTADDVKDDANIIRDDVDIINKYHLSDCQAVETAINWTEGVEYQYDIHNYGKFEHKIQNFYTFPLSQYIVWFMLIPCFADSLKFDFISPDETVESEVNNTTFNHCRYVQHHNLLSRGLYIGPFNNGELFFVNEIVHIGTNRSKAYYIKDIKYDVQDVPSHLLETATQQQIKKLDKRFWNPVKSMTTDLIQKKIIHGCECWCITKENLSHEVYSSLQMTHSKVKHKDIKYKLLNDNLAPTQIFKPDYQHASVRKQEEFLFIQIGHDGVEIGNETIENYFWTIANSTMPHTNLNCMLFGSVSSKIPHQWMNSFMVQDLLEFDGRHCIWKHCADGFKFIRLRGELSRVVVDNAAKQQWLMAPNCGNKTRSDGRTNHPQTISWEKWNDNDFSVWHMDYTRHPDWCRKAHCKIHNLCNKRVETQLQDCRQWKSVPNNMGSRSYGVSNLPHSRWRSIEARPIAFNPIISTMGCFYHIVTNGGCIQLLFKQILPLFRYDGIEQCYNAMVRNILLNNAAISGFGLDKLGFAKINQGDQMHEMFAKWLFLSMCLPSLLDGQFGIGLLVQMIRLINMMMTCKSDQKRRKLQVYAKLLFRTISREYPNASNLNTPKFRMIKEVLDLDMYFFGYIGILEAIWIERNHQLIKTFITHRSNHHHQDYKDLAKWKERAIGLRYAMMGGRYGYGLSCYFDPNCADIRDPRDTSLPHSVIAQYVQPEYDQTHRNQHHQSPNIIYNAKNNFPRVAFKNKLSTNANTKHFWKVIADNNAESRFQFISRRNLRAQHPQNLRISKCTNLLINDGRKSNLIHIKKKKIYLKINFTEDDTQTAFQESDERILHTNEIYLIQNDANRKSVYIGIGKIYSFEHPAEHKRCQYLLNFNRLDVMSYFKQTTHCNNTRIAVLNCSTVLESVLVTHDHRIPHSLSNRVAFSQSQHEDGINYPVQTDWIQTMQTINNSRQPLPCGPILICAQHSTVFCNICLRGGVTKKNYCRWHCSIEQDDRFLIWDSEHCFLPGLFKQQPYIRQLYS